MDGQPVIDAVHAVAPDGEGDAIAAGGELPTQLACFSVDTNQMPAHRADQVIARHADFAPGTGQLR